MFTTYSNDHLIRQQIWGDQIKEAFEDELIGMKYVNMISDFGGDVLNIPSIGQAEVSDYSENSAIKYSPIDTGNYQFSVSEYKSSGVYVTNKMKQDSYLMGQVMSMFAPKMTRAIMKSMEIDLLAVGPNGQTAGNANLINGAKHRFVAGGTNETIELDDFHKALYALKKANVPATNLIAIVDPSLEYHINSLTVNNNVSNNPRWEGIVETGIANGMSFIRNIAGFDIYTSQNLKVNTASETVDGLTAAAGVNNLFFSADSMANPFIGMIKQAPTVESEYNKDRQREEHVVTARYGFGLYRPESLVVVLTDTDQVYA